MKKTAVELVDDLVEAILQQRKAVRSGSTKDVRYWARRITPDKIRKLGDEGNRELARLLSHADKEIRMPAAIWLIHCMPDEALAVFNEIAKGPHNDFHAMCARMRIKEWEEYPEHYKPGYRPEPVETGSGAVVLAAGEARRFGSPKLLMPFQHSTVLGSVVKALSRARINPIAVVAGANEAEVTEALKKTPAKVVRNPDPSAGMVSSIRVGVEALPASLERFLIVLGDQPRIRPEHLADLISEHLNSPEDIVIPVFDGKRGHPVVFDIRYRREILELTDQQTLRDLIEAHHDEVIELELDSDGYVSDIDTREDYERELQRWRDER